MIFRKTICRAQRAQAVRAAAGVGLVCEGTAAGGNLLLFLPGVP